MNIRLYVSLLLAMIAGMIAMSGHEYSLLMAVSLLISATFLSNGLIDWGVHDDE